MRSEEVRSSSQTDMSSPALPPSCTSCRRLERCAAAESSRWSARSVASVVDEPFALIRYDGDSGHHGSTASWKSEKRDGTRKVYRHFSIEPKMWNDGCVRKLANAMPITIPTCEHTPTEPRMPIGEISVMYEPATICATPATTPTQMRPSTSTHHTVPYHMNADDMKTKTFASSSVFFRPRSASGTTTPYEPISPPIEKHELMKAHCAMLIGLPAAASVAGTMSDRLLSEPVANPNWSDEPSETEITVASSRSQRNGSSGCSPRSGCLLVLLWNIVGVTGVAGVVGRRCTLMTDAAKSRRGQVLFFSDRALRHDDDVLGVSHAR